MPLVIRGVLLVKFCFDRFHENNLTIKDAREFLGKEMLGRHANLWLGVGVLKNNSIARPVLSDFLGLARSVRGKRVLLDEDEDEDELYSD